MSFICFGKFSVLTSLDVHYSLSFSDSCWMHVRPSYCILSLDIAEKEFKFFSVMPNIPYGMLHVMLGPPLILSRNLVVMVELDNHDCLIVRFKNPSKLTLHNRKQPISKIKIKKRSTKPTLCHKENKITD